MGTVVRFKNIRFVIRSNDHAPPHVHVVSKGGTEFRINLETLGLMDDTPYSAKALKRIFAKVKEYRDELLEKWREYHDEK